MFVGKCVYIFVQVNNLLFLYLKRIYSFLKTQQNKNVFNLSFGRPKIVLKKFSFLPEFPGHIAVAGHGAVGHTT